MKQTLQFLLAALWRWDVVGIGSTLLYGFGVGAMYGDDYLIAGVLYFAGIAWLTAKVLAWEETKSHPQRKKVSYLILVVGIVVFGSSLVWINHRNATHMSEAHNSDLPEARKETSQASETAAPPPGGWLREWGKSIPPFGVSTTVDASTLLPLHKPIPLMLVYLIKDDTVDEQNDTRVVKSNIFVVGNNPSMTIEVQFPRQFLDEGTRLQYKQLPSGKSQLSLAMKVALMAIPRTAKAEDISKISDATKLGGKVLVINGFGYPVEATVSKKLRAKKIPEKPLTLRMLFNTDFPHGGPLRDMEEMLGPDGPNPVKVKFTARLWMDFHEGIEFFGFYIPRQSEQAEESSKITVRLARNLPIQLIDLRKRLKVLQVTVSGEEGSAYKSDDLILSPNVYIYHEDSLSVQEISAVVSQFESMNLKLQLRGSHYLFDQQALRLLRPHSQP